ncbi:hypothetical protein M0804_013396 [Polistes exclamans]|nr:hypothetical protein M0804_013396 [Polistes exclamans]
MTELFIEMLHENIHESVKQNYPAINFTKLSYEEIINHYFSYFDYSDEILSKRKPFQHRNHYEREAIIKYADNLQVMFNNNTSRYELQNEMARKYCCKLEEKWN